MATKLDKELAYQAGTNVASEPGDRRAITSCPFEDGSDERIEWLKGFRDAISTQPDPGDIEAAIEEASA